MIAPLPSLPPGLKGPARARALARALQDLRVDWDRLGPLLVFDPERYGRRRLHLDMDCELLMLCWLPGQGTPIHDHGRSWGAARPLLGDLREERYRRLGPGSPLAFQGEAPLGGTVEVGPATLHRIANKGSLPAVSLHLFSPPLAFFRAFDPATGQHRRVEPRLSGVSYER